MNEHDLQSAFDDLARRGADEQAERLRRGDGLSAGRITAGARRRRTVVGVVASLAVLGGVAVAGGVAGALPTPVPPATPTPAPEQPTPTTGPTPEPAPGLTPTPTVAEPDGMTATGFLRAYPSAPAPAWTAPGSSLWPFLGAGEDLSVGDPMASYPAFLPFRVVAVDGTWLVAGGSLMNESAAGVDAATGDVRWVRERSRMCGGAYDDLLVCLDANGAVALLDPVRDVAVRTLMPPEDLAVQGLAVFGDTVVVHSSGVSDVVIDVVNLDTGAVDETVLANRIDPDAPVGDSVTYWERSGSIVRFVGLQYTLVVDTESGALLAPDLAQPTGVRADGWVEGQAADGTLHAVGPQGQDVLLPGESVGTVPVWVPTDGLTVPLLTNSVSSDGSFDGVHAVDPTTGTELWSVPGATTVLAVGGRTAVLRAADALVGVDVTTGAEVWRAGTRDSTVVVYDGTRFVLSDVDGTVQAVDAADGGVAWTATVAGRLVAADDTLAVVGEDGSLTALPPAR
jgi:outer membrane protein assembly factor BamB